MIFEAYEADMRRRGLAADSITGYSRAAASFERYLAGRLAEDAQREDVEAWLGESGWSPASQKTAYAWIRAAYSRAVDLEQLDRNPCRRVTLPKIREQIPRTLSLETLSELERRCRDDSDVLYLRLHSYTGMRASEVRGLTVNDVDMRAGTLDVLGKGGKPRVVPIHPMLRETLLRRAGSSPFLICNARTGGKLTAQGSLHRLIRIRGELDAQRHDFRRTVVTNLRRNGADVEAIKTLVGHSRDGVHSLYSAVSIDDLHRCILRLYV